jgi:thiaminase/transcriptional activator TenA
MGDDIFERLKSANAGAWDAYIHHPFVAGLADGSLPDDCFRRYLGQDYLFLIQFARAYGLAAYKSTSLEDIRQAAQGLSNIINLEMELHVEFCAAWGLSREHMEALPEAAETMAYTRFVLETGLAGDALDLHVALAPCIIGYGEIGLELASSAADNPYAAWIAMYASDDYQGAAEAERRHLDTLFQSRAGVGRMPSLERIFGSATRLEAAFWQMGLDSPIVRS